jgi:GNAT superfamily N-acetyltransferase
MELNLTPELIDQIIFGMENQKERFFLDLDMGELVEFEAAERQSLIADQQTRYIRLPEWNSSKGFQLMEKFIMSLHNPVAREMLRDSLTSGKGVFRNFKNVLKESPEIERLWYHFKEHEMKSYVVDWYTSMKEARELENVQLNEEDETDALVLSDFVIDVPAAFSEKSFITLDREAFNEIYTRYPDELIDYLYENSRNHLTLDLNDLLCAETPSQELAGFLWVVEEQLDQPDSPASPFSETLLVSRIIQIYVQREYRGLGLAKALLEQYLEDGYKRGIDWIFIEMAGNALRLGEKLSSIGFSHDRIDFSLNLRKWGMENLYS